MKISFTAHFAVFTHYNFYDNNNLRFGKSIVIREKNDSLNRAVNIKLFLILLMLDVTPRQRLRSEKVSLRRNGREGGDDKKLKIVIVKPYRSFGPIRIYIYIKKKHIYFRP